MIGGHQPKAVGGDRGEPPSQSGGGTAPPKRAKGIYVGAPACFVLELACQHLHRAFCNEKGANFGGIYLVGSALERPDWRDIDVRLILDDASFDRLFPDAGGAAGTRWEFDQRWIIMTASLSAWLSSQTGLPVDFQFQPMSHANERHSGRRNALGLVFAKEKP
jgi:hypothetical protein